MTRRWKRYPKYKPSGVEWLGEVPKGWCIKRLKFFCTVNPCKSEIAHHPEDMEVSFLPMENIGEDHALHLDIKKPISEVWNGYTYFQDDDVLLAKITPCFENGKSAVCKGLTNKIGFGTTELHVLRATNCSTPEFLYYLIQSHAFRNIGTELMFGTTGQKRLPEEFVKDYTQGIPSISGQTAIAAFLDRETARIDALIEKKERQIELLKEKRAALISHAVTKGLDPSVKMKETGIEWLGEIPDDWKLIRLRFLCSITTGSKNTEDNDPSGQYPFFVRSPTIERLSTFSFDEEAILTAGDGVGVAKVFHYFKGKFDVHQRVYVFTRFKKILGYFLFYYIRQNLADEVLKLSAKSTVDSLRLPMLQNFPVLVPPKNEQEMVISHLDDETKRIDFVIQLVNTSIEKLREYRSALISAAVTGKIDVRDEAKA